MRQDTQNQILRAGSNLITNPNQVILRNGVPMNEMQRQTMINARNMAL
jgi:hypothetical protein